MEEKNRSTDSINYCTFYKRTNDLLKALEGMPQVQMGKVLGLTQSTISDILSYEKSHNPESEYKNRQPSANTLYKIAKYFNVSTDYLLGLTDIKTTDNATKELCKTTGLSEISIDILTRNLNSEIASKIKKSLECEWEDWSEDKNEAIEDISLFTKKVIENYSTLLAQTLNWLIDEFAKVNLNFGDNGLHERSIVYLLGLYIKSLHDSGHCQIVDWSQNITKDNISSTVFSLTLDDTQISALKVDDYSFFMSTNVRELLINSVIDDINVRLHTIKHTELLSKENEYETHRKR